MILVLARQPSPCRENPQDDTGRKQAQNFPGFRGGSQGVTGVAPQGFSVEPGVFAGSGSWKKRCRQNQERRKGGGAQDGCVKQRDPQRRCMGQPQARRVSSSSPARAPRAARTGVDSLLSPPRLPGFAGFTMQGMREAANLPHTGYADNAAGKRK